MKNAKNRKKRIKEEKNRREKITGERAPQDVLFYPWGTREGRGDVQKLFQESPQASGPFMVQTK